MRYILALLLLAGCVNIPEAHDFDVAREILHELNYDKVVFNANYSRDNRCGNWKGIQFSAVHQRDKLFGVVCLSPDEYGTNSIVVLD